MDSTLLAQLLAALPPLTDEQRQARLHDRALTSLEAAVARLPDGRGRRGRRYPLPFLLLGLVAGLLAGCDSTHAVEQWCADPPTVEVVYLLTPLPPERASPADLLELVRGHWHIEKGLHHVRDAACDQDRSRRRTGYAPQFLVALRTWS